MIDDEDPSEPRTYEVGYGKPPKAHQFKSKNAEATNGKPKRSKTRKRVKGEPLQVDLGAILRLPVSVTRQGRTEKMDPYEAVLRKQVEAAVKDGKLEAIKAVVDLATEWELIKPPPPAPTGGVLRYPIKCAADLDRYIEHFSSTWNADPSKPEGSHE